MPTCGSEGSGERRCSFSAASNEWTANRKTRNCLFGQNAKRPMPRSDPYQQLPSSYTVDVTLRRQVAVHEHAGRERVTRSQQSIGKPPACRIGAQKPGGRSLTTPKIRSSASPALTIVPSSNNRPISVTPWGTRRGGEKVGRG